VSVFRGAWVGLLPCFDTGACSFAWARKLIDKPRDLVEQTYVDVVALWGRLCMASL
jgi:hypothetical protein